jgi:hypothetical protein
MLTFEIDPDGVVEVNFDSVGRDELLAIINSVEYPGDHTHAMAPSWGGDDLTEEFPNPSLIPAHSVTFQWVDHEDPAAT